MTPKFPRRFRARRFSKAVEQAGHHNAALRPAFLPVIDALEARIHFNAIQWANTPGSGNWNVGSNWVGGVVPGAGDTAVFPSSTTIVQPVLTGAATVQGIAVDNSGGIYSISETGGTQTLTIGSAGISVSSPTNTASDTTTIAPNIALSASQTWTAANNGGTTTLAVSGGVSGSVGLTTTGSGEVTLSGVDSYSGGTTVSTGTLELNLVSYPSYPTNIGAVAVDSGGTLALYNTQTSIDNTSGGGLLNGTISGSGTLDKIGPGYSDLWGGSAGFSIKNFSGAINVQAGTLANNGSDWGTRVGGGDDNINLNVASGANFDIRTGAVVIDSLSGAGTIGTTYNTATRLDLGNDNNAGSSTFTGVIENGLTITGYTSGGTVALTKNGSGTQTLSGAGITYTGGTTISGGTLRRDLTVGGNLGLGSIAVGSAGTLELYDTNPAVESSYSSSVAISGSGTIDKTGAGDFELYGSGASIKNFSGAINVEAGTLASNGSDWGTAVLGGDDKIDLNISSGANLDIRTGGIVIDSLSGAGTIGTTYNTATTLNLGNTNNAGSSTFSGVIENGLALTGATAGGTVALIKNGTGAQTLTGIDSYSGGTTVSAGTLALNLAGYTGYPTALGAVNISSAGTLALNNTQTTVDNTSGAGLVNARFSGSGTIDKTGAGYMDLWGGGSGTSIKNFSGQINVQAGTLGTNGSDWGTAAAGGDDNINLNIAAGANVDIRTGGIVLDSLSGAGTIGTTYNTATTLSLGNNNNLGPSTFSGAIGNSLPITGYTPGGTVALAKNGSGTQILSGSSDFSGTQITLAEHGALSQTVNLAAGTYNLDFTAAQATSSDNEDFQVLVDGTVVGSYDPAGITPTAYSASYTVSAGTHTISFAGVDTAGGANSAIINLMAPATISPWHTAAIGGAAGTTAVDSGGNITLSSNGTIAPSVHTYTYVGAGYDSFNTVYQPLGSNQQISAEVTSQTNSNALAKAGLMMRTDTSATAAFAGIFATPGWGVIFLSRSSTGAQVSSTYDSSYNDQAGPVFVKLTTSGGTITGWASTDGTNWSEIGSAAVSLGSAPIAGMAVDSTAVSAQSTATFANVALSASITSATVVPKIPYEQQAESYSGTDGRVWWAPTADATTFTIQQSTDGGTTYTNVATVPGTADTYLPNNLSPNTTYTYRVFATNSIGNSPASAPISMTTTANLEHGYYQTSLGSAEDVGGVDSDSMDVQTSTAPTLAASWEQAMFLASSGSSSNYTMGLTYPLGGFTATSSGSGYYGNSAGYIVDQDKGIGLNDVANTLGYIRPQIDRLKQGNTKKTPSTPNCDCPGCCGNQEAKSADGPTTSPDDATNYPVGYSDGSPQFIDTDLSSSGFSGAWSITRNYTTQTEFVADNSFGYGWMNNRQTYLQNLNNTPDAPNILVVNTAYSQVEFDYNGSSYVPTAVTNDSFTHNVSAGTYSWLDSADGSTSVYYDFSSANPANLQGKLKSWSDAAGDAIGFTYNGSGELTNVGQSDTAGDVEKFNYTYNTSGPNAGQVASIQQTMQRAGAGSPTLYRQALYTYYQGTYTGDDAYGNQGDLRTVSIEDGSGNVIDGSYYRYFTPSDVAAGQHGYVGGLKYVFQSDSYSKLAAAYSDPFSATDTQVAPLANNFFEYNSSEQAILETAADAGTSSNNGLGTMEYAYAQNPNFPTSGTPNFNTWWQRTTETLPDGNEQIVYTNINKQALLTIDVDSVDPGSPSTIGTEEITAEQYDADGHLTATINPSAINNSFYNIASPSSYESYADLGITEGGVSTSAGLIDTTTYAATTTATRTTAGNVAGYAEATYVAQGLSGTPIEQTSMTYISHTDSAGNTIYPEASSTQYRNTNGTGAETTSTAYVFYSGTNQEYSVTTSAPVISSAENGPGTADVTTDVYDTYGNLIWSKDADGYISYNGIDLATGATVQTIQDVNTASLGDLVDDVVPLPTGWSTPSGGGLNLVTTNVVDNLGRTTETTDPNGNVTYTVYNDDFNPTTGFVNEVRTYPGWHLDASTGLYTTTGPVTVTRTNQTYNYTESLSYAYTPVSGVTVPADTDAITASNIQSLSRSIMNDGGQTVETDAYFGMAGITYSATSVHLGTASNNSVTGNYSATFYGYDAEGRQYQTIDPTGTITDTVFDGLDRASSSWVGTDDATSDGNPFDGANAGTGNNMTEVSSNVYDNGGSGDSNITQTTQYPNGATDPRVTQMFYDWRDRQVAAKAGVLLSGGVPDPSGESDGVNRPITYTVYDNLGEAVEEDTYDGDGVTITSTDGVPNAPNASLLVAKTDTNYDDQGRDYQTQTYSVTPGTGAVSTDALTSETFYDHRGDVIASSTPSGLWTKNVFDGAGRETESYTTDGGVLSGASQNWANAGTVANDVVLSQTDTTYDADGNVIETADHERLPGDPQTGTGSTGSLGSAIGTGGPAANVYYATMYYDAGDRETASVNVGTNGGSAYTPPLTVPASSDSTLVTLTAYGADGMPSVVTDPRGIEALTEYDLLGRTTETVAAWDGTSSPTPTNDTKQITTYTYDGDGNQISMTAVMPSGTPSETTHYVYGVAGGASGIFSNDLLATVEYPDATTGAASTAATDDVTYTYDALGETTGMTDENGTNHAYSYDVLGRETLDAVTTLGSGVDGTVMALGTTYNAQGLPFQETSYANAAATTVFNQDQDVYNGLGQLTGEYQSVSGAVNASTTPEVQYDYSDPSLGSRQTTMTYPNGRVIDDVYNSGIDTTIGRVGAIADAGGSAAGSLQSYTYQGLDTIVGNADGNGVTETTTLDNFGRTADMDYVNSSGNSTDDFAYGYDRDGNVLYKNNLLDSGESELYHANSTTGGDDNTAYDPLNRLTGFERGTLSASGNNGATLDTVASASASQSWNLNAVGDQSSVTTNGTTTTNSTNSKNELTGNGANSLTYDNNGNTLTNENGQTYTYDAWNRMATAKDSSGTTIAVYTYDPTGRRITETSGGTTTDVYFTDQWQDIEERQGGTVTRQNVWGLGYANQLVERDDNSVSGTLGISGSGLGERLFAQQDANWNVASLVDTTGNVVERMTYSSYGSVSFLAANWMPTTDAVAQNILFQGGRFEVSTGDYLYQRRDEDPNTGRWVEQDPAQYINGANRYQFEFSNPSGLCDPDGSDAYRIRSKETDIGNGKVQINAELYKVVDSTILARLYGSPGTYEEGVSNKSFVVCKDSPAYTQIENALNQLAQDAENAAQWDGQADRDTLDLQMSIQLLKLLTGAVKSQPFTPLTGVGGNANASTAVAAASTFGVVVQHGTTLNRANGIAAKGPDPNFVEPGDVGAIPSGRAGSFFASTPGGPYPLGSPTQYALGKAAKFPNEGGPAILDLDIPPDILKLADDSACPGNTFEFTEGPALSALIENWASVIARVIKL